MGCWLGSLHVPCCAALCTLIPAQPPFLPLTPILYPPLQPPNPLFFTLLGSRKRQRIASQFDDLQSCYLRIRAERLAGTSRSDPPRSDPPCSADADAHPGTAAPAPAAAGALSSGPAGGGGHAGGGGGGGNWGGPVLDADLQDFGRMLGMLSRCSRLEVIAEIPQPSLHQSSNIVSSLEFDRDGTLFATAGVSKRIRWGVGWGGVGGWGLGLGGGGSVSGRGSRRGKGGNVRESGSGRDCVMK